MAQQGDSKTASKSLSYPDLVIVLLFLLTHFQLLWKGVQVIIINFKLQISLLNHKKDPGGNMRATRAA